VTEGTEGVVVGLDHFGALRVQVDGWHHPEHQVGNHSSHICQGNGHWGRVVSYEYRRGFHYGNAQLYFAAETEHRNDGHNGEDQEDDEGSQEVVLVLGVVVALGLFGEALVLVVDVDTEVDGTRHSSGSDQE